MKLFKNKELENLNMTERVLAYMKKKGSITTKQAVIDLGCCDLQSYIRFLRKDYDIKDEWIKSKNRFGTKVQFKKYYLTKDGINEK